MYSSGTTLCIHLTLRSNNPSSYTFPANKKLIREALKKNNKLKKKKKKITQNILGKLFENMKLVAKEKSLETNKEDKSRNKADEPNTHDINNIWEVTYI